MRISKVTIQVVTLSVFLAFHFFAAIAQAKGKASTTSSANMLPKAKLSTDIHFDGVTVRGRRQSPFGASSVVESEKKTPDLIDYRNDYNDRLQRSKSGR